MPNTYKDEIERVEEIQEVVIGRLSGRTEDVCLDREPLRKYSIGIITPLSDDEQGYEDTKKKWLLKRRPSSIGLEARFETKDTILDLSLSVFGVFYYRSIPLYKEELNEVSTSVNTSLKNKKGTVHFRQKYKKIALKLKNVKAKIDLSKKEFAFEEINNQINAQISKLISEVTTDKECWFKTEQEPRVELTSLESDEDYKQLISQFTEKESPNWQLKLTGKINHINPGVYRLSLLLSNETNGEGYSDHPKSLFDTKIECELNNANFKSVPFKAAEIDYRYSSVSFGKGVNCVIKIDEQQQNKAETITTPLYILKRSKSRENLDSSCNFNRLAGKECLNALEEVGKWLDDYSELWKGENKQFLSDSSINIRKKSYEEYVEEVKRFKIGMEAIKKDKKLLFSFKLANKVFSMGKHSSWKLFQLVFIITQMPSLLAREHRDQAYKDILNRVDVLWFPTGGGKTEAYFGVIVVAMFFDRLRGKKLGVTAWLRYPLRMLSIQQLQRLVEVVTNAEKVRESVDEMLNSDPFTVGYYVGSANTPNELTKPASWGDPLSPLREIENEFTQAPTPNDKRYLVLQRCPYCYSNNIDVKVDNTSIRIKHFCRDCNKEAPIFISDSEIYRYLPTVIVGTVDRLARVGQTSMFSHLFGNVTHICPDHGYASFNTCVEANACKIKKLRELPTPYDPAPSLLLQDELHLLKESLGTYDSHYELVIDELCNRVGSFLPPKRIAATATIEGYQSHIRELYGRTAIRFPVKGIGENDSAYVEPTNYNGRYFIGLLPSGSNVEEVVSEIITTFKKNCDNKYESPDSEIVLNYDLSLAYVNQKNTAGNVRSRWEEEGNIQVLTGDKGLGEVRSTISKVETDIHRDFSDRLKSIVATSIISHGVDLERLNVMTFAGMPNFASDYIQASSRVGRKYVGIVFTVFKADSNRDRNIYQRFYEYHERLYQLVQPVPINHFSESSIKRTLPGILAATVLCILAPEKRKSFDRAKDFLKGLYDNIISEEELITRVLKVYDFENQDMPQTTIDYLKKFTTRLIKDQLRVIPDGEGYKFYQRLKPQPVSSLREVSEQIKFEASFKSSRMLDLIIKGRKGEKYV